MTASAAYTFDFVVDVHEPNIDLDQSYGSGAVSIKSTVSTSPTLIFDVLLPRNIFNDVTTDAFAFDVLVHNSDDVEPSFTCYVEFYNINSSLVGSYSFRADSFIQNSWSGHFDTFGRVSAIPNRVRFVCSWSEGSSRFEELELLIYGLSTSSDGTQSVIQAIHDQTSDIQQSINDQYGGDPGSSFPVDDIITQHNEKMGVLSFGSDTLMQVLGLLSPDQSLSSELVFPSMSLTIAGQRNKVQLWPEYRFDLNELKQHWPDFVGLMQSLTTALVWIFVLRYCYRVFEKYFLAGGGN